MSYSIYIGNAEIEVLEDIVGDFDNEQPLYYRITVNDVQLPDAPTFPGDETTGNGNSRHTGYSQWSEFCQSAKLYDLFFDNEMGLMISRSGNMALREDHAKTIEQALARWKEKHPDAKPGFAGFNREYEGLYDAVLARLIWLDFWVKWALKNCERPAIYNS